MDVRVRLFGAEAAAAGQDSLTVTLTQPATCRDVVDALARSCPALQGLLAGTRVALNHEFAAPDDPVRPGDEVALIGLVSGG